MSIPNDQTNREANTGQRGKNTHTQFNDVRRQVVNANERLRGRLAGGGDREEGGRALEQFDNAS